jgi:putative ABC transport system permease protein
MILHYVTIAVRALLKKKIYTFINILGLSVGAATSFIILAYVLQQYSYDKFLPGSDRVYRMVEDRIYPDRMAQFSMIPDGFCHVLPEEIPEVEKATRLVGFPNFAQVYRYKDKVFAENYFFAADSNFFDVFPFKLLKGNPARALYDANTIVMTRSTAKKFFGDEEPVGAMIQTGDQNLEVVAVMEDVPENSHMKFDALLPMSSVPFIGREPNYYIAGTFTYVKLARDADPKAVDMKMPMLIEKYAAGQIERDMGVSFKKYIADGNGYRYYLQALQNIHLHSHRSNEIKANGDIVVVRTFIFVSIIILVIAAINFINLATARSAERAKEVGVRKVLGSRRKQLVMQFLSESTVITMVSIVIALVIIQASLGYFNTIARTKLDLDPLQNPGMFAGLLAITVALGIFGGLYPAFYISALKPVQVLKGKFKTSSRGSLLRNGLVVFQFSISVILITATLVVYQQLDYMQHKGLGFEKENLLVINHNSNGRESHALQHELRKLSGIESVGSGGAVPGGYYGAIPLKVPGSAAIFTPKLVTADDNFIVAMKYRIIEGRGFSQEFNDSLSVVINERAARALGLDNPVGATLLNSANPNAAPIPYTIVGIVEDFNFESLHSEIAPLIMMSVEGQLTFQNVLAVRVNTDDIVRAISSIEGKWKELVPNEPFSYSFMDTRLNNLYSSEQSSRKLLTTFTLIAIIIACVGLFGLAAYTANQRTKEIGIRKVLGATVFGIVKLLSKDFALLVFIAFVIGCPIAWYLMREWLSTFAYRTTLGASIFLMAGGVVLAFTIVAISYQAISAARVNPVESLKDE